MVLYLPVPQGGWSPVEMPDSLYKLVVGEKRSGRTSSTGGWNPGKADGGQWRELQDAAVRVWQAFPDITAEAATDILWKRHQEEGWLPNEDGGWVWSWEGVPQSGG